MLLIIISLIIVLLIIVIAVIYSQNKTAAVIDSPNSTYTPEYTPDLPPQYTPEYIPTPTPAYVPPGISNPPPIVPPPTPTPIPDPVPAPAPPIAIPTCDGDKAAYYYYYNPDVLTNAFEHWQNSGWRESRKSCWPIPTITLPPTPTGGACDGVLAHEAAYYFNLYPDVWQASLSLTTQAARDTWAKGHWLSDGYKQGRTSCWPAPTTTTTTSTTGNLINSFCEGNWNSPTTLSVPANSTGNLKIVSSKYGRYDLSKCIYGAPYDKLCAGMDVTAKMAALCDGKKTCKIPSAPVTFFGSDPCQNVYKEVVTEYKIV